MSTLPVGEPRRPWRRICRPFVLLISAVTLLAVGTPAVAGLIFNSVRFDGHVRNNNGSGPVSGVEAHFTDDDFPPPTSNIPLPATPPPPPSPLDPANDLRIQFDFAANAPLNGNTYPRVMLWITSPTTGNVFANDLDDTLATPIEFETFLYLEELPADQQLDVKAVLVEVFDVPPTEPAADTFISNNIGSAADPINIRLKMTQDQLLNDTFKMFIYYGMTARVIPEPATVGLLWAAIVGVVAMCRRLR